MNDHFGPTSSGENVTDGFINSPFSNTKRQGHRKRTLHEVGEAGHLRNRRKFGPQKMYGKNM